MDAIGKMLRLLEILSPDNVYYSTIIQVIRNIANVPNMTIYELSSVCFVSTATISRMTKFLGYSGFAEFKAAVSEALKYDPLSEPDPVLNYTDSRTPSINVSHYLSALSSGLNTIQDTLTAEQIAAVISDLQAADNVGLFLQTHYYCMQLQRLLFLNGKNAPVVKTLPAEMAYAEKMEPNDVIIIAIHGKHEFDDKAEILQKARENGAKIVMLYAGIPGEQQYALSDHMLAFQGIDPLTTEFIYGVYLRILTLAYKNALR